MDRDSGNELSCSPQEIQEAAKIASSNALTEKPTKLPLEPGNFEDAIKATGFGKFNIALLGVTISSSLTQIAEQTNLTYVIPIAHCDLNLSLEQRGLLVSVSYMGMIFSAIMWGYLCDTYGRRKVIAYGYIGNAACFLLSSLSQNYAMLFTTKLASGFMFTGPFTAFLSYLTEFHSTEYRSRIQLVRGLSTGIAVIVLPMVAWIILPQLYEISILGISLHSWNVFMAVCCLPALTTGTIFLFMPESPKYLMTSGKNSEALDIFKKVYNRNTGRRFSSFPIKALKEEKTQESIRDFSEEKEVSIKEKLLSGFSSVKPLFRPPYLLRLIHMSASGALIASGAFTVKMWYPQILQSINDYDDDSSADICNILNYLTNGKTTDSDVCNVNLDNSSVYINSTILGAVQLVSFFLAGIVVNKTGKKLLAITLSGFAAACPMLIYFIPNGTVMIALFPFIIAFAEVTANLILTITMEVFPTTFRTTATNFNMMCCRIGILSGNIALPYILKTGCFPPLIFISVLIFGTTILVSMVPKTDDKVLE